MHIALLIAAQVLGALAHGPGATRPGFISLRAHASDVRPKASEGAADCDLACGDDAPKKCVEDCHAAVYQCMNTEKVHNTKETERCRKAILNGIKHVRTYNFEPEENAIQTSASKSEPENSKKHLEQLPNKTLPLNASILAADHKVPNKTLPNNTAILAADRKVVRNKCAGVCGENVNSSCITSCEMEMYQCIDHTLPHEEAEGKREECFKKVLKKYEGFKEEWNATHGLVARHDATITNATKNATAHYVVTDADRKMIKDVCDAACTKAGGGAPSSMCVTHCETDMYRCIKETLPDEMDERKKCRKDTQAKYEAWGSSL